MKLAVKLYKDAQNPKGIPGEWPAEVKELSDDAECPAGFSLMSHAEYADHRALYMPEYLAWEEKADPKGLRVKPGEAATAAKRPWWKFWGGA